MSADHLGMRILLRQAFKDRFGRDPSLPEVQCVQAVAWLESSYGRGWRPPGVDSFNLGAIQAGSSWGGDTFQYTDTRPNPDGTSTPYVTKFRKYKSAREGADDLVRVVYQARERDRYVLPFASAGDTLGFSRGLHKTAYYEGFGRTVEDRIRNHHKAVVEACERQARALAEPMPGGAPPPRPRLVLGSQERADVQYLQRLLNGVVALGGRPRLKEDGDFGAKTADFVRAFQRSVGLKPDAIVGPATWAVLLLNSPPGAA